VWSGRIATRRDGMRLLMARADLEALVMSEGRSMASLAAWAERARPERLLGEGARGRVLPGL
jgi:hypothetical protein